jgi:hypothetical protein
MSAKLLGSIAFRCITLGTVAALLGLLIGPQTGAAQATLRGRVVDSETGREVAKASVRIRGDTAHLTTDSAGRFEARDLPGGDADVTLEALGYARGAFHVPLPSAGVVNQIFALDFTGYKLPEVVVKGRIEQLLPRYTGFEQRRARGIGAFLRWDDLLQKGSNSVGDALRTIRGVRIQCDQRSYECYASMARSPNCHPTWWIDGVEVRSFNENTPIRDVYGIEIYRGPGEVPGEYAGSDAACGVIVMWTKSRPFR